MIDNPVRLALSPRPLSRRILRLAVLLLLAICLLPARAQVASPHAIDIPRWFTDSFLDFREDVREAAREGRRVMLYFGQDGCPYCSELMRTGFTQQRIVERMKKDFVAVSINIWGDREVTWIDGKTMSEKDFARRLKVQFTPTLLFLDEKGAVVARLNGYYPPHRLEAAIGYVAGRLEKKQAFAEHMKTAVKEAASEQLHEQDFFLKSAQLARKRGGRPLAALFETRHCAGCDELHREGFRRPEIRRLVQQFDVARFALGDPAAMVTPDGRTTTADRWARELAITYTPTLVFFDAAGREVFRVEAYVRPFHLASAFDYVASGAYRKEPSFQRFVQARAERLRERGERVDLWK